MGKTIELCGFPSGVSASDVKSFVEQITGEGTVYALKIRQGKGRLSKTYAIVQFTTNKDADFMVSFPEQAIWYGSGYLKGRELQLDIVPKPRTYLHTLEDVTLFLGCPSSKESFSVFWRKTDVEVRFGLGLRKLQFFLSHGPVYYRLDLSYENIWQIELHQPQGQQAKYLLIQLFGAPRVFEQDARPSKNLLANPLFNYYKDGTDDQWVRATDFTPSCSLGQSSAICLKLPNGHQLPDLRENFPYYVESERNYGLEMSTPFSCNLDLVPMVNSPPGIDIPFGILFKVNSLIQNGCLSGPTLDRTFYQLVDPRRISINFIEHALDKLFHLKELCAEPSKWLAEQYWKYRTSRNPPRHHNISLDSGLAYVRRVQITPCKVYFCGPEVNVSNRVTRHFHQDVDNFLRVSFVDEELEKLYSTDISPRGTSPTVEHRRTAIYKRILDTLRNGITIGNKRFEFLAFSSSQLRDNSTWMFASRYGLTAADIRNWMGNFRDIRNVAKYAARLGQSFGSSTETLGVGKHEIEMIPDIEINCNGGKYNFSDGIGKISSEFAQRVAQKCGLKFTPSAFQIRYGGYKGVVAVDPHSSVKLSLRKSMLKYKSENNKLDVLAYSKFQPCFLNRQVITLLSTLGVKDHIFEKKQKEAIKQLDAILTDSFRAQEALDLMTPGENADVLKEMLRCGYKPDKEPFLSMMLQILRASKLLELRMKARIFIPNGRAMMGCLDETRTLEYGQVFVQISCARFRQLNEDSFVPGSQQSRIVKGKVVVAKNPCLHPGDVRVLEAVDIPALHHMVDCIVFPQKGKRPHPNECSGSDLDGDIYFVSWDPELIPSDPAAPMEYTPAKSAELDHDVTIAEVEEYFANYIVNDSLGIIANAHTVFADKETRRAWSSPCIELAKLFSIAVDFPKTGVPAIIPSNLYVREYPDFMEKFDKPTYESTSVIGKLYRQVRDISPHTCYIKSFTREVARQSYERDMEVNGFEDYLEDAFYHKSNYDYKLGNLMDYYGIKTEAEILSGNIMRASKSFTKKRDGEAISMAVASLRKEARSWFDERGTGLDLDDDDEVYAKASAWYHVTYHPSYWGCYNEGMNRDHYLSFAWCVYDKLVEIKKAKTGGRMTMQLFHDFRRKFHLV